MSPHVVLLIASIYLGSWVLAGATLLVGRLMGGRSAAVRHHLYLSGFLALALLPLSVSLLPLVGLPIIPLTEYEIGDRRGSPASIENGAESGEAGVRGDRFGESTSRREPVPIEDAGREGDHREPSSVHVSERLVVLLPWLIGGVWLFGVGVILTVQLVRWAGVGFIASMGQSTRGDGEDSFDENLEHESPDLQSTTESIRREFGIRRPVQLLLSELAAVSMAWGLVRHWVILPTESRHWPRTKSEAVLRHELSHIKRRDNFVQLFTLLVCALHWLNPFIWLVLRRLNYEREASCDDAVINSGTRASTYAQHLMELAQRLSGPKSESIQPAVMAHSSDLKKRLMRVLETDADRRALGKGRALTFTALALLAVLPLSTIRPWGKGIDSAALAQQALIMDARSVDGFRHFGQDWALRFDGRGSHVVVPDSDDFDFGGNFTIEARIKVADLDRVGRNHMLISKHRSHAQGGEWAIGIEGPPNPKGRVVFSVWNGMDSSAAHSEPGAIAADKGWQDLAFCYSAASHRWSFFVDGEVAGSGTTAFNIDDTERDLWIGWESNEPHHCFEGWIRDLRLSDDARYEDSYPPGREFRTDEATLALWNCGELDGTVLRDLSGNGHHGMIVDCIREEQNGVEILVSPGDDLQAAVDAAPDSALITLLPGVHTGAIRIDGRILSLRGSGAASTYLDSERRRDFTLLVANGGVLRLSDLTLTRCYNDRPRDYYFPAAITVDGGRVELTRCRFEDNLNALAAWRSSSVIHASYSTFLTGDAVAVLTREADTDTEVSLTRCTIEGTRADHAHGLIKMWGGGLDVNRCVLSMPRGRAIEYHGGSWDGSCNIVHAAVQASGGLVLPEDHRNVDPRLNAPESWRYDLQADSPALPENNECGERLGSDVPGIVELGSMSATEGGRGAREVR